MATLGREPALKSDPRFRLGPLALAKASGHIEVCQYRQKETRLDQRTPIHHVTLICFDAWYDNQIDALSSATQRVYVNVRKYRTVVPVVQRTVAGGGPPGFAGPQARAGAPLPRYRTHLPRNIQCPLLTG